MFSVIMPLYNKQETVKESIQSVLLQTVKDFELIIVDDGSTDQSAERVQSLAEPRIRLWKKNNKGVSAARNYGVEKAQGDYICFLDADDLWLPNHLETLKKLIAAVPDAGLYATSFRQEDDRGIVYSPDLGTEQILEIEDIFQVELNQKTVLHTNSICMPKSIFIKAGGFIEGECIGEDTSLWFRVAAYHKIAIFNEVTTVYRLKYSDAVRTSGTMNRSWSFLQFYEEKIKNSDLINIEKKNTIARFVNRYRHSLVRHDLLEGKKDDAKEDMKKIEKTLSSRKENLITRLCFGIPHGILIKLYKNRG